jgi:hypothetical protein
MLGYGESQRLSLATRTTNRKLKSNKHNFSKHYVHLSNVPQTVQNIVGTLTLEIERTKIFYYDFTNYTLLRVDTHSNISKFKRLPPVSGTETDN